MCAISVVSCVSSPTPPYYAVLLYGSWVKQRPASNSIDAELHASTAALPLYPCFLVRVAISESKCAFVNSVRLWFQLVRDVTIIPSGMDHFRLLHGEVRERATKGDVWILTRALEEVRLPARVYGRKVHDAALSSFIMLFLVQAS